MVSRDLISPGSYEKGVTSYTVINNRFRTKDCSLSPHGLCIKSCMTFIRGVFYILLFLFLECILQLNYN